MKENKTVIFWSLAIASISLAASIILHCRSCEYASNIFSGIFASALLAFMIAVINYHISKRRTLENFYSYAMKAVANYNLFENDGDLERTIDSVLLMDQFDYLGLDTAYGEMCFVFNNDKNHKYVYDRIYLLTLELRRLISEKCFHFREYRKSMNGNKSAMKHFVEEIDCAIMERKTVHVSRDGSEIQMVSVKNRIVEQLLTELNGKYYELMYGKKTII